MRYVKLELAKLSSVGSEQAMGKMNTLLEYQYS